MTATLRDHIVSAWRDFLANWTTQMRKGLLELCVLATLKGQRMYGYDIVKRLSAVGGPGDGRRNRLPDPQPLQEGRAGRDDAGRVARGAGAEVLPD